MFTRHSNPLSVLPPDAGRRHRLAVMVLSVIAAWAGATSRMPARDLTWIDGDATWVDGTGAPKWTPADEPDADDAAIFDSSNTVHLGSNNEIQSLWMANGINLFANGNKLEVNGSVYVRDGSSRLNIDGAGSMLRMHDALLHNGGVLELAGGAAIVDKVGGIGQVVIDASSWLTGSGVLTFSDKPTIATSVLVNSGSITASSRGASPFSTPPVGTLQINASGNSRVDLDGESESGKVNVNQNQTLEINAPIADAFSGTMSLYQNAALDMSAPWSMSLGTLSIDNGFVDNSFPLPDVPAGASYIRGATLTVSSGSINVLDGDGVLQFDAPLVMNGGLLSNKGHVIFNNNATIARSASLQMAQSGADLSVGAGRTVSIDQSSFDMDGLSAGLTTIAVQVGGSLDLNADDYDPGSSVNAFDGTVSLYGGRMTMTSADSEFVMNGILNMHSLAGQVSEWSGEPIDIGNDSSIGRAKLYVSGVSGGIARFSNQVDIRADADVNVGQDAHLVFASTVNLDTVNGGTHAQFTGSGTISFNGPLSVNEATSFHMPGGTIDLDGSDTVGDTVAVNAPLTISAATLKSFGRVNLGGGVNTLNIDGKDHSGSMTVTLDNPTDQWTLGQLGVMNLTAPAGTTTTLIQGNGVNLHGTVTVTGGVGIDAQANIGGDVSVQTAGSNNGLVLQGGHLNRLSGGAISGPGLLRGETATSLYGFGILTTDMQFSPTSDLLADNGILTLNGDVLGVGTIGTADDDGVLNSSHIWNTNVATFVVLRGGQIKGSGMTIGNPSGVFGHGLITARVVNNERITATSDTLTVHTDFNDNDWDGSSDAGVLAAQGGILELVDNFDFPFSGTVKADSGRVFVNGFAFDFNSSSLLQLANAGLYQSTSSTTLAGIIEVESGATSTIQIDGDRWLTFASGSSTSLNGNLRLSSSKSHIESGAAFSGSAKLVIAAGTALLADANANIDVLVSNDGEWIISGQDAVGRVDVSDFEQSSSGSLIVEVAGNALNEYDRLVVNGTATLGGRLEVDLTGFSPAIGSTFNVLTTTAGLAGEFDIVEYLGLPLGKGLTLSYLSDGVQLSVVSLPVLAGDFDEDGDVDGRDFLVWQRGGSPNPLSSTDLDAWRTNYGATTPAASIASVPEPASWLLASLCMIVSALLRSDRNGTSPATILVGTR